MKLIYIYLAFLFIGIDLPAQSSFRINGFVMNEDKAPIEAATVLIDGSHIVGQTDRNGFFQLTLSGSKLVTIHIDALGYFPLSVPFTVASDLKRNFILRKNDMELNEVVVSGDSKRNIQMGSSQNLIQSLEGIPGVKAMNIGSGQSKPAIRGLGFNRMIVVENGIRHEGQQWGEDHGLEIDQFAIDNIEIIKGPGSLLYGSDAIGGVINMQSDYVPVNTFEGRLNLFARTNNESIGLFSQLAGRKDKFYYKANMTLIDYADYKVPTDSIQYYSYYIKLKDRRLRNTAGKEQNAGVTLGYISERFKSDFQISNVYAKSGFFCRCPRIGSPPFGYRL